MKINPFAYGRAVDGDDYCPRVDLEKIIRSNFISGQNMALHGERRIGKTSLVVKVGSKLKGFELLYVDFLFVNSVKDVVDRIAGAVLALANHRGFLENAMKMFSALRPVMSFDTISGAPTFSLGSGGSAEYAPETVEAALDAIYQLHSKRKLAVVFDEFQDVLRLPNAQEVLAKMRSRIQFHTKLTYVFTGSHRSQMVDIFSNPNNPFYKSAMPIAMDAISGDRLWKFLIKKFEKSGFNVASDFRKAVDDLGVDATGDVQQVCKMVWDVARDQNVKDITTGLVVDAVEAIFLIERNGYQEIASTVSPSQLKLLRGISKMGGDNIYSNEFREACLLKSPSTVTSACRKLENRRLIYKKKDCWKIDSPFFCLWLKNSLY